MVRIVEIMAVRAALPYQTMVISSLIIQNDAEGLGNASYVVSSNNIHCDFYPAFAQNDHGTLSNGYIHRMARNIFDLVHAHAIHDGTRLASTWNSRWILIRELCAAHADKYLYGQLLACAAIIKMVFMYVDTQRSDVAPDVMGSIAAATQIASLAGGVYEIIANVAALIVNIATISLYFIYPPLTWRVPIIGTGPQLEKKKEL
ncbi:hypothetical protein TELCIR_03073 [Teladorsagia circumcincta]|uniref:Uncharacterized protein n=1 Tax=Teladorsagia circumcincta TaxID=45464 RepID=A0A2G9UXB3_TELCI|nr:hypothetical protein TELCIR_03073 [Teladorsagia circumcincta]